jgi:serine/threonine protein kinase
VLVAVDDPMLPNLMHLAADLLDPDLELQTDDLACLDPLAQVKSQDPETPASNNPAVTAKQSLGGVADYEFVARYQGSDITDVFLAHKMSEFGFVRRAVVKRARPESELYEISREMLLDEAKALAWIDHPNVISILDFGEVDDGFYLAMEHVDGTDLRQVNMTLRRRREALPLEIAAYLAIEVLRGLHHAHTLVDPDGEALDILHRDVNPSNVLVSKSGHIKITDFGVVRMRDRLQDQTQPGIVKGKFSYMAREYILGRKCDCRVDVYAVGIMLLEMLTGRPCFSRLSVHEVMRKIVEHDLPLHRMRAQEIPEKLCSLVDKATARDPNDRFESAELMAKELETWLIRSGGHASAWIVSAFFEQHDLWRHQGPKPKISLDEKKKPSTPAEASAIVKDPVAPIEDKAEEVAAADREETAEEPAAPLSMPEKTTVSETPFRLQPVEHSGIIELENKDVVAVEIEEDEDCIDPTLPWSGKIKDQSVAEILKTLIRSKAEGTLQLESHAIRKTLYFTEARCVAVQSNVGMEDLSELLVQQKVIPRADLDRMMMSGNISDQELGPRLIKEKRCTTERFAKIHGQQIQSSLEDILVWRSGDFAFEPGSVKQPAISPQLHIELILLPHLGEKRKKKKKSKKRSASLSGFRGGVKSGGSLSDVLRMARKVTRGSVKGKTDRIDGGED